MNKKILIMSILSIFILVLLPSIPAVEYNISYDVNKKYIIDSFLSNSLSQFDEKLKGYKINSIIDKNNILNIKSIINEYRENHNDKTQPQCIILTFIFLKIIFKVIGSIIAIITATVSKIIDLSISIIKRIINLILTIVKPMIKIIILFLIFYFIAAAVIDFIFLVVFLILSVIPGGYSLYYLF